MTEPLIPRVFHSVAYPFVEGGRRVRQAGSDVLRGGRSKRIDDNPGQDVRDIKLLDATKAVTPMAVFLGTVGFSTPLFLEFVRELVADVSTVGTSTPDVNWWWSVIGTGVGLFVGSVINAEHSRRVGRNWRKYEEEVLEDLKWRRRMHEQPPKPS